MLLINGKVRQVTIGKAKPIFKSYLNITYYKLVGISGRYILRGVGVVFISVMFDD